MVATIGGDSYNERAAAKTYFPNGYSMSLAMRRARAQYFWRNVRGMIGAAAFGASVYWYSIKAVSQDDFSDLTALIPSAEERASISSIEDINAARAARKSGGAAAGTSSSAVAAAAKVASSPLDPAAAAAAAASNDVLGGRQAAFGLAPRLMWYWPTEGLVQHGPSLALGGGTIGSAPAVDWSKGMQV